MKKGSSSKGGSSSQKLSDKKMRKMEARVLEEKLVTLRAAVFEPDGKDRNVCAPLAPFMKYDRNGLDCTIDFYSKLPADAKLWAFELVKSNMEELYDEAGYGWDDQDKLSELSEDGTRFLVARNKSGERIAFAHFRFTVQGDVVDQMRGDTLCGNQPVCRVHWLGRAARNRHRHAIEQASRRWRGGRRDDSARTRRKI